MRRSPLARGATGPLLEQEKQRVPSLGPRGEMEGAQDYTVTFSDADLEHTQIPPFVLKAYSFQSERAHLSH